MGRALFLRDAACSVANGDMEFSPGLRRALAAKPWVGIKEDTTLKASRKGEGYNRTIPHKFP